MRHPNRSIPCCLLALAAGAAFAAEPPASGSFVLDGETFTVADAIAYPDEGGISVVVSNRAFDRREFARDGKIDDFDVLRHAGDGVASFTIEIGGDGTLSGYSVHSGNGGGGGYNSEIADALRLTTRSDTRVAGSLEWQGEDKATDLRFDLPVQASIERPGQKIAAGGGEIGKALVAHFEAMASGDKERLLAMTPPDRRAETKAMMDDPEATAMLGFLAAMAPREVRVTGGVVDGDTAVVDYEGVRDGAKVRGSIDGMRVDGRWYFNNASESSD
jgi:hypothetical protein